MTSHCARGVVFPSLHAHQPAAAHVFAPAEGTSGAARVHELSAAIKRAMLTTYLTPPPANAGGAAAQAAAGAAQLACPRTNTALLGKTIDRLREPSEPGKGARLVTRLITTPESTGVAGPATPGASRPSCRGAHTARKSETIDRVRELSGTAPVTHLIPAPESANGAAPQLARSSNPERPR